MQRGWRAAVFAAVLGAGSTAWAHEFDCDKRVNGQAVVHIEEYPITVRFDDRLINIHPTAQSLALGVEDPGLASRGWSFQYPLPLAVPVGGSADQFAARLVCDAPYVPPPPYDCQVNNDCPEPRVTRDEGFFKVHELALQQCLEVEPVDLGSLGTVSTLEQALGVLWASPSLYHSGEPRTPLDTARLLLARQVLVAECNVRLFGSPPRPSVLLENGRVGLSSTQCPGIGALRAVLREQNVEGREEPLPWDIDAGPATPAHAQSIAQDFTQPSGESCIAGP